MVSTFTALSIQGHACSYNWVTEFYSFFSHIFSAANTSSKFFASMNVNCDLINPLIKCAVFCSEVLFLSLSKFYASKNCILEKVYGNERVVVVVRGCRLLRGNILAVEIHCL